MTTLQAPDISETHYIRTITQFGDRHKVIANRDIFNPQGIKLVAKGTTINSHLFEKLIQHKLIPPLDQCLSISNAIDTEIIIDDINALLNKNPILDQQLKPSTGSFDLLRIARKIHLNPSMTFKLTVTHAQHHELWLHSLLIIIISINIGYRVGFSEQELVQLASAALFHDLGQLHLDPKLFTTDHILTTEERRHLYSHPLIAYLIVNEFHEYPKTIAQAILEHHERLDGSGYPQGLSAENISIFGKILAVSEVVASRCDSDGNCHNFPRLEILLKLNTRKLSRELIALLTPLYTENNPENDKPVEYDENLPVRLLELFSAWDTIIEGNPELFRNALPKNYQSLFSFINTQIQNLLIELRDAGFDPRQAVSNKHDSLNDEQYVNDVFNIMYEAHWQLKTIINEAQRRWRDLFITSTTGQATQLFDWLEKAESLNKPNEGPDKESI